MYKRIKYFEGLSALRFFAAYFVVLHHAEQIRRKYELHHLKDYSFFNNGSIAVTFFFVLSGFLITYLLLKERTQTQDISIKNFYIRRVLRIWPLYYLLVFLGTLLIPLALQLIGHNYEMPYSFSEVILYYVFFMPFMVNIFFGHHLLEPLWSIGVEELFYLFWAPLYKFLKDYFLIITCAIIILKTVLNYCIHNGMLNETVASILSMLKFEAMAIGGLGAYWLFHRTKTLDGHFMFSYPFQIGIFTFLILRVSAYKFLMGWHPTFDWLFGTPVVAPIILIIAFLWLILNTSMNQQAIFKLNKGWLNFLGDISYGIYMYHMVVIFSIVLVLAKLLNGIGGMASTIVFYLIITTIIIIVSALSKKFFEDPFLRIKKRF